MSVLDKEGWRLEWKAMKFMPHQNTSYDVRPMFYKRFVWRELSVGFVSNASFLSRFLYIFMIIQTINPVSLIDRLQHCPDDIWKGHRTLHMSCILSVNWFISCTPRCDSGCGHLMYKHYTTSLISEHQYEPIVCNKDFHKVRKVVAAIRYSLRCSS